MTRSPERVKEELESFLVDESADDDFVAGVAKLPKALRSIGYVLLGRTPEGELDERGKPIHAYWQVREQRAVLDRLDGLAAGQRTRILRALFGPLAEDVEATWQDLKGAPVRTDQSSTMRRAPSDPAGTLAGRVTWLFELFRATRRVRREQLSAEWLATWTPWLTHGRDEAAAGRLLASSIDRGNDAVFEVLRRSALREHDVGAMGRHVTVGLFASSRVEGWELLERMLLAAERQEGLRQVIFESVEDGQPEAFRRVLRLVRDEGLVRFSSVAQAMGSWFGIELSALTPKKLRTVLEAAVDGLGGGAARDEALSGDDAERAHLALWAIAYEDAHASIPAARTLLGHADVAMRYVAADHLAGLYVRAADEARIEAMGDEDERVGLAAVFGRCDSDTPRYELAPGAAALGALARLKDRMPKKRTKLEPLVWPGSEQVASRVRFSEVLRNAAGEEHVVDLLPHLADMDPWIRRWVFVDIGKRAKWSSPIRRAVLDAIGDRSKDVRKAAMGALAGKGAKASEAEELEARLAGKSADVRAGVLDLISALADRDALASATRLLEGKSPQRAAGVELLRRLFESKRCAEECAALAADLSERGERLTKDERIHLDAIATPRAARSVEDALGLLDPAGRTKAPAARNRGAECGTDAAIALVKSIDDLVHTHRREKVRFLRWGREPAEELLGEIRHGWSAPDWLLAFEKQADRLPLAEVWLDWNANRPDELRDADGGELIRARTWLNLRRIDRYRKELDQWAKRHGAQAAARCWAGTDAGPRLRYAGIVDDVLDWLIAHERSAAAIDTSADLVETFLALLPDSALDETRTADEGGLGVRRQRDEVRELSIFQLVSNTLDQFLVSPQWRKTKQQWRRCWRLWRTIDEPVEGAVRRRASAACLAGAYEGGAATLDDLTDHLLGPPGDEGRLAFFTLSRLTERRPERGLRGFLERPEVAERVTAAVDRVLEIELARGEGATPATVAALSVKGYRGVATLLDLLVGLEDRKFKRTEWWQGDERLTKASTFTHMIAHTWPADGDTSRGFAAAAKKEIASGRLTEERLVQLTFLAPQWSPYIEASLGWAGYTEGVYWTMAHMRYIQGLDERVGGDDDDEAEEESEGRRPVGRWERLIRERTTLTEDERDEGAIDVAWFQRTHRRLGAKRWEALANAARFASTPGQAKRARYIADVLLGKVAKRDLVAEIEEKHLKESVRLLGLLPLAKGAKRKADLVDRYEVLEAYRRYARGLSSMNRPEAMRSCDTGLRNLASTAGYADPLRLQWAMEAASTADLARGPVVVSEGDVSLTVELDTTGAPQLEVRRGEKVLKNLPKAEKKLSAFVELRARFKHLEKQASRVALALEASMCRGDAFTGAELAQLADHALLWPRLERLVLVGEGLLGYPVKRGRALRDHAGKESAVGKKAELRIAHPHDLLKSRAWSRWQRECLTAERIQPFKQVFRELYVVTPQEREDRTVSRRYAAQQVLPRQARALWGRRDWEADEYGEVFKAFPDEGLCASVSFDAGITTPLEVEGSTIEDVRFASTKDEEPVPTAKVPPRIFSEVMRDMDLVVSVAHAGEVDPEASASTVEMRAALIAETCELLSIRNVDLKDGRAVVRGALGEYSVHLGSGVVHRLPGGSLCLVPVHAQHRGRLFLPFADDDPRTAEVVSKVLMLARDDEIDDPIVLEQLRAMG